MNTFELLMLLLKLAGGIALLWIGAELIVRGAAALAASFGIAPMTIGLTVVAFATSSPELMVSVVAAVRDEADICIGNVIGSNIFNVLAILGLTAILCPIRARAAFIRREIPLMVAISLLMPLVAWNGMISRLEAAGLVLGLVLYMVFAYTMARRDGPDVAAEYEESLPKKRGRNGLNLTLVVVGLLMLVGGSHLLVVSAKIIAHAAGIRDAIIALTVVAFGTSLPELATSVIAARRNHPDIALGNIIGSNVFNVLSILGFAGLVRPLAIEPGLMGFDIPFMVGVMAVMWIIVYTGRRISRGEGIFLFAGYLGYTAYRVLAEL